MDSSEERKFKGVFTPTKSFPVQTKDLILFVINGLWIEMKSMDGFRYDYCLPGFLSFANAKDLTHGKLSFILKVINKIKLI